MDSGQTPETAGRQSAWDATGLRLTLAHLPHDILPRLQEAFGRRRIPALIKSC